MTDMKKRLERAYRFSRLLKIDCIKEEIAQNIEGYSLKNVERENGKWICSYTGENDDYLTLMISFNDLSILKVTNNKAERINVGRDLVLLDRMVEKREKGLIYSVIEKHFASSERLKSQIVLIDLIENRCTLTMENIKTLIGKIDFDNARLLQFLLALRMLESRVDLKKRCALYSQFAIHMNYYASLTKKDEPHPVIAYLNDEDVSNVYNIYGSDSLYRIFDLYRGIINPRNEKDIWAIHSNLLPLEAYDLESLKGKRSMEDSLVGKSLDHVSEDYITYLKQMLYDKFGYTGELSIDRDSILNAILYKMSDSEIAKRKNDEKMEPDCSLHIDGIQVDEVTSRGHRKIFKRIFDRNSD